MLICLYADPTKCLTNKNTMSGEEKNKKEGKTKDWET